MTDDGADVAIRWVRQDEVETYRAFRLRALADAPDAFGDSLAAAEARPWSAWVDRVAANAAGETSVLVVAVDAETDTWLGMTGSYLGEPGTVVADVISVWVAPEARRRRIASALMEGARAWARSRGATQMRLWVTATNARARALYAGLGYRPTGTSRPLASNPALQDVEMTRPVDATAD